MSASYKQVRLVVRFAEKAGVDLGVAPCEYDPETKAFSGANCPQKAHFDAAAKVVKEWKEHPVDATESKNRVARWLALGDAMVAKGVGNDKGTGFSEGLTRWKNLQNRKDRTDRQKAESFIQALGLVGVATFAQKADTAGTAPTFQQPVQAANPLWAPQGPAPQGAPADKMAVAVQLAMQGWSQAAIESLLGIKLG